MNTLKTLRESIESLGQFNFNWSGERITTDEVLLATQNMIDFYTEHKLLPNRNKYTAKINRRSKSVAGWWKYKTRSIEISEWLPRLNKAIDVEATIRHELAHAISYHQLKAVGHCRKWKEVAIALGDDGVRCYGDHIVRPKGKWTHTCPKCNTKHEQHKSSRGDNTYWCRCLPKELFGLDEYAMIRKINY